MTDSPNDYDPKDWRKKGFSSPYSYVQAMEGRKEISRLIRQGRSEEATRYALSFGGAIPDDLGDREGFAVLARQQPDPTSNQISRKSAVILSTHGNRNSEEDSAAEEYASFVHSSMKIHNKLRPGWLSLPLPAKEYLKVDLYPQDLECVLRHDPNIVVMAPSIVPSEPWRTLPFYNPQIWTSTDAIHQTIQLGEYLRIPYVLDSFGLNKKARNTWKDETEKIHRGFKDYYSQIESMFTGEFEWLHDRLRTLWLDYGGLNCKGFRRRADFLTNLTYPPASYRKKPIEEKIRFFNMVKQRIRGLLTYLSAQVPDKSRWV